MQARLRWGLSAVAAASLSNQPEQEYPATPAAANVINSLRLSGVWKSPSLDIDLLMFLVLFMVVVVVRNIISNIFFSGECEALRSPWGQLPLAIT